MVYRSGRRLRMVAAGVKLDEARGDERVGRRGGWVDLTRPKVEVELAAEWRQMLRDAWRQMRDFFWTEDMGGVDWDGVYERYAALVERVSTRTELSDLLWELQGEIGTSHAYEMSEAPDGRDYGLGALAAEYAWDEGEAGYRITRIIQGDTWSEGEDSPLRRPGVLVTSGDVLVRVNGRALDRSRTPGAALVGLAGEEVALGIVGPGGERTVTVRALAGEGSARYREWVERNRAHVHDASGGRIGYVHVPDMMTAGYAEFHRGYLTESRRDALLLDVRYNRGGAVSWLLMDKLRRRVISYRVFRGGDAQAFPVSSVRGPMACLTNAFAGSDGDAVCQEFKLYGLGPVIGTRTWGGTIGITGERRLVDGSAVTQPEMRRWFAAQGWNVENHGVDPDIEVEERPEDARLGRDRQLERAVAELLRRLEQSPPPAPPDAAGAPSTAPPVPPWLDA
jgi:tricorn protease